MAAEPFVFDEHEVRVAGDEPREAAAPPAASADLVRAYLRDIGGIPLLTAEQEVGVGMVPDL